MCCLFVISLCVRVFFNSPTQFTWKQDWVMCCSFVISCVVVFFNSPTHPPKQIKWCAAPEHTVWFFNSPTHPTYEAGIEWCAALLWLHVLGEYFSTVPPTSTHKAGIVWWLLLFHVLGIFSTVPPNSHLWSRDCDVLLFLWLHVKSIFQQSYPPHP
jgi:hypothetical protein